MTTVDKNIPMPRRRRRRLEAYPWAEMAVNDSFAAPTDDIATFRVQTSKAGRRYGRVFTVLRVEGGGFRCWRIE